MHEEHKPERLAAAIALLQTKYEELEALNKQLAAKVAVLEEEHRRGLDDGK